MSEYLCDTDWENKIDRLRLNISSCPLMAFKLIYLYELILLYFASIKQLNIDFYNNMLTFKGVTNDETVCNAYLDLVSMAFLTKLYSEHMEVSYGL